MRVLKLMVIMFYGILTLSVFAGGEWLTDFEQAKKESRKKKLPILADFSGSDWCGWCQRLDAEVFQKEEFLAYAKDNLILFLADFPRKSQQTPEVKKQNEMLKSKYQIGGYPTILLLDADGVVIAKTGYKEGGAGSYVKYMKGLLKPGPAVITNNELLKPGLAVVTNSLKMKFVPLPGTEILFSIWETRVQDYEAFVRMTARKWKSDVNIPGSTSGYKQRANHPVVKVSWDDAKTFCVWITEKEQMAGKIKPDQQYRLPYDWEWSVAAGLNEEKEGTPQEKSGKTAEEYPWGRTWPPPAGAANYCGEEAKGIYSPSGMITGYNDAYVHTSPAGSFKANPLGLYDMGGNVWEWCEDHYDGKSDDRVLRGASWCDYEEENIRSSYRYFSSPDTSNAYIGFRCVLTISSNAIPISSGHTPDSVKKATFSGKTICAVCGNQLSANAAWVGIRLKDLSFLKQAKIQIDRNMIPVLKVDEKAPVNSNNPVLYYHGDMKKFRLVISYNDGRKYEDALDPSVRRDTSLTNIIEVFENKH